MYLSLLALVHHLFHARSFEAPLLLRARRGRRRMILYTTHSAGCSFSRCNTTQQPAKRPVQSAKLDSGGVMWCSFQMLLPAPPPSDNVPKGEGGKARALIHLRGPPDPSRRIVWIVTAIRTLTLASNARTTGPGQSAVLKNFATTACPGFGTSLRGRCLGLSLRKAISVAKPPLSKENEGKKTGTELSRKRKQRKRSKP